MSERTTKGRAYMRVTDELMQHAPVPIEKPKEGIIRWGKVEVQELFDTFQSFLLLPKEYSIVGVFYDPLPQWWEIIVESEAILLPSPGEMIPLLCPSYETTTATGKVRLVNMNLPERWHYYAGEASTE